MRTTTALLMVMLCPALAARAQDRMVQQSTLANTVFEAEYMERPPVFQPGNDSLNRLFFAHFTGWQMIIEKAVANGDTAKYIRVNFSFIVDKDGAPYEPAFTSVSSTRYASARYGKPIKYFNEYRPQLTTAVAQMVGHVPLRWTPGLLNGRPVRSRWTTYVQVWVGLGNPPQ